MLWSWVTATPERPQTDSSRERASRTVLSRRRHRLHVLGSGAAPRLQAWPPTGSPACSHLGLLATSQKATTEILARFWGFETLGAVTRERIVTGFNERHGEAVEQVISGRGATDLGKIRSSFGGVDTRVNRHSVPIGYVDGDPQQLAEVVIALAEAHSAAFGEGEDLFSKP